MFVVYLRVSVCVRDSSDLPNQAVKYLRQAAELGYGPSQSNVGVCYETGKGVQKDLTQAIKWYLRAALGGNSAGKTNIARMEAISLPACYQALAGLVGELMHNEAEVRAPSHTHTHTTYGIHTLQMPTTQTRRLSLSLSSQYSRLLSHPSYS